MAQPSPTGTRLLYFRAFVGYLLAARRLIGSRVWNSAPTTISQMTGAAGQIAQGRFEVHVADRRRDEIGELSKKCSTCQGVPEAALEEIFVPFYRLDPSRNHETGGVGLGLAIVKACIESCRGAVRCRNLQPSGLEVEIQLSEAKL